MCNEMKEVKTTQVPKADLESTDTFILGRKSHLRQNAYVKATGTSKEEIKNKTKQEYEIGQSRTGYKIISPLERHS